MKIIIVIPGSLGKGNNNDKLNYPFFTRKVFVCLFGHYLYVTNQLKFNKNTNSFLSQRIRLGAGWLFTVKNPLPSLLLFLNFCSRLFFYNSCKCFQQAVELAAQGFTEMDGKPIVQVIKNTKAYSKQEKKRRKVIKT